MTPLLLWVSLQAAAPLGPCADAPGCTARSVSANAPPELARALGDLGLQVGEPGPVAALQDGAGDVAFEVAAERSDGAVEVTVRSLHRPREVYGQGQARVMRTREVFSARALQVALRGATQAAFEDLAVRIQESLGRGVRRLRFAFKVNGLEQRARAVVREQVLPCLQGRLALVGPPGAPREQGGYLEAAVDYAPAPGEPREPLDWHVAWVKAALLGGPRAACTLVGGPLAALAVKVSADALNGAVVVEFTR